MSEPIEGDEAPLAGLAADAAAAYHRPADIAPRETMWAAIQTRRAHTRRLSITRLPRWSYAAAATALLVAGIGIGRQLALTQGSLRASYELADTAATRVAWQEASTEHFGSAETMLTWLASSPDARAEAQLSAWSRDLLGSTRLLIDSPAGRDPKRRALLMELELVLVQLVESGPAMRTEDRTMMDELLTRSSLLLTRIRTTVPAGMTAAQD